MPFVEKVKETLAEYERHEVDRSGQPLSRVERLEFDDVSFSYVPGVPVIRGFSFQIERGGHRHRRAVGQRQVDPRPAPPAPARAGLGSLPGQRTGRVQLQARRLAPADDLPAPGAAARSAARSPSTSASSGTTSTTRRCSGQHGGGRPRRGHGVPRRLRHGRRRARRRRAVRWPTATGLPGPCARDQSECPDPRRADQPLDLRSEALVQDAVAAAGRGRATVLSIGPPPLDAEDVRPDDGAGQRRAQGFSFPDQAAQVERLLPGGRALVAAGLTGCPGSGST